MAVLYEFKSNGLYISVFANLKGFCLKSYLPKIVIGTINTNVLVSIKLIVYEVTKFIFVFLNPSTIFFLYSSSFLSLDSSIDSPSHSEYSIFTF